MLEGRGIDFASIGAAMGARRAIQAADRDTDAAIAWARREEAMRAAMDAGRLAQLRVLRQALRNVDPEHPALRETGLVYADGERQVDYQAAYDDAYDGVARTNGIPPVRRAMTPADQAEAAVLAEPVEERSFIFCRRFFFRGEEHRSRAGAERARARAAAAAREAVHA